jgi:hypothetical protein
MNMDGRWYSFTMKISARTHGTIDQGGSICGVQKNIEGFAKAQTRPASPDLMGYCHGVEWLC